MLTTRIFFSQTCCNAESVCLCVLQMEEKARLEAEAREREEQQLLEEQQRRQRQEEEEAALQKELLRLQELQQHRAAKKKKKEKAKENTAPPQNNPQPLKQTAQNVLDNLQNGKSQSLLQTLIRLPDQKEPKYDPVSLPSTQHSPKHTSERGFSTENNIPNCPAILHNGTPPSQLEVNIKVKSKQSAKVATCEAAAKKAPELPKSSDVAAKLANGTTPTAMTDTKAMRIRPAEALAPLPTTEPRREDRCNIRSASGKRQQQQLQQPLTQIKEDRRSPPVSNPSPSPPPASQSEQTQQNGKPPSAESPQPKSKTKKNKKKKGDKMNTSIGRYYHDLQLDLKVQVYVNVQLFGLTPEIEDIVRVREILTASLREQTNQRQLGFLACLLSILWYMASQWC